MQEKLCSSLQKLNGVLTEQRQVFHELGKILASEEYAIKHGEFLSFETILALKNKISQRLVFLEKQREPLVRLICSLMAADTRHSPLSLEFLINTVTLYVQATKGLLQTDTWETLKDAGERLCTTAHLYKEAFSLLQPQIAQNGIILKKMLKNVSLSLNFFYVQTEQGSQHYTAFGKTNPDPLAQGRRVLPSVCVKV